MTLLVTVATAVFSKQMGSLIKWIGCNVVAVNVVGADAVGVSQGGKELLPGEEFGLLHAGVSVLLVQRLVWCFLLHCRHRFFDNRETM